MHLNAPEFAEYPTRIEIGWIMNVREHRGIGHKFEVWFGMRFPDEVSHLSSSSIDEYQRTVTLLIYQICEQMMCYHVVVVHDR